ncbi:60S ribosomal protein L13-like [Cricetulus griseus]|uniref:60S ribosomal protein L13-like n=1 Tax=Cricetulus griseus TaxID=10029 RepID=A0A9J7JGK9_CRIGR|nr:60S ribosomal protein L13-like [Cricetulus griseus]
MVPTEHGMILKPHFCKDWQQRADSRFNQLACNSLTLQSPASKTVLPCTWSHIQPHQPHSEVPYCEIPCQSPSRQDLQPQQIQVGPHPSELSWTINSVVSKNTKQIHSITVGQKAAPEAHTPPPTPKKPFTPRKKPALLRKLKCPLASRTCDAIP